MSERSYNLLTKIIRAVSEASEVELQNVVGYNFMKLSESNLFELKGKKASPQLQT